MWHACMDSILAFFVPGTDPIRGALSTVKVSLECTYPLVRVRVRARARVGVLARTCARARASGHDAVLVQIEY